MQFVISLRTLLDKSNASPYSSQRAFFKLGSNSSRLFTGINIPNMIEPREYISSLSSRAEIFRVGLANPGVKNADGFCLPLIHAASRSITRIAPVSVSDTRTLVNFVLPLQLLKTHDPPLNILTSSGIPCSG